MDIRNPDGSFMSDEQILEDILPRIPDDDVAYMKTIDRNDMIGFHHTAGQALRNAYGLWSPDNPHTETNPTPNARGVVDHPRFPDQVSHEILLQVWDRVNA